MVSLLAVQPIQGNLLEIRWHKIPIGGHFREDVLAKLGNGNRLNKT